MATLERWRANALSPPARERVWTAAARLQAVIATAAMDQVQRGAWCRENDVYPTELQQWKESATAALSEVPKGRVTPQQRRDEKRRIKELERDLRRKDKALAETTALLVLSKVRGDLATRRGRMIALKDRQRTAQWVEQAREGARLRSACEVSGIEVRTLQCWKTGAGLDRGDGRPHVVRPPAEHALSAEERKRILQIANEPRLAELPPAQIVPMLAEEGIYIASESSFSRVLRSHGQSRHRGRAKAPERRRAPSTHVATAPGQLWCWDPTRSWRAAWSASGSTST